jgi:hypothetical protein
MIIIMTRILADLAALSLMLKRMKLTKWQFAMLILKQLPLLQLAITIVSVPQRDPQNKWQKG